MEVRTLLTYHIYDDIWRRRDDPTETISIDSEGKFTHRRWKMQYAITLTDEELQKVLDLLDDLQPHNYFTPHGTHYFETSKGISTWSLEDDRPDELDDLIKYLKDEFISEYSR